MSLYTISAKRLYDSCPKKFWFRHRLGLDSIEMHPDLARGVEFHQDAEQSYLGETEDLTLKGIAYDKWVQDVEDLTPLEVEFPVVVPLGKLEEYLGRKPTLEGEYGGVVDLVVQNPGGSGVALLDHKTVKRFYTYSYLYATEQLGMYQVAWEILTGTIPKFTSISRVKLQEDTHPAHYQNYLKRYLKTKGIVLNNTVLKYLVSTTKRNKGPKGPSKDSTKYSTRGASGRDVPRRLVLSLREPRKKGSVGVVGVSEYTPEGLRTLSIQLKKSTLIHITRDYYHLPPEELHSTVEDFLSFVKTVQGEEDFRRAPGIHCARCPFQTPCWGLKLAKTILARPEDFGLAYIEPNQEVLKALKKREANI